ncbi:B1 protein [Eumeta japonica]|uniref:B1 protein n=1 Tax=Eumeta variegata TaxID=151549 RepID=A0A4C1TFC0_EUMVA|nr:B1 protein [Eumeta japonica]
MRLEVRMVLIKEYTFSSIILGIQKYPIPNLHTMDVQEQTTGGSRQWSKFNPQRHSSGGVRARLELRGEGVILKPRQQRYITGRRGRRFTAFGPKVHLTPDQSARLLQNSMQCIMDTGVTPDVIMQVKDGKFSEDEAFRKFLFCVFRKSGVATKDGHIKVSNTLAKYPNDVDKEPIRKVLEECNKEEGKTPVDRAFSIFKCFHAKTPVHIGF